MLPLRYLFAGINKALTGINQTLAARKTDSRQQPELPRKSDGFSSLPHAAAKKISAASVPDRDYIPREKYKDRSDLTEFNVPKSVTAIGFRAFQNCTNLKRVTLPEGLLEIQNGAFEGCTALEAIVIPDSVKKMGNYAFSKCTSLRHFRFPKGMEGAEIPHGIFYDCTALETVNLPERASGHFSDTFQNCTLLHNVTLPEGITEISSFTFKGCEQITELRIPSSVKKIEYKAFLYCTGLKELFIPDTVESIDLFCTFAECTALERLRLPVGITFRHVFNDESEREGIAGCFANCTALKTIFLGSTPFEIDRLDDNTLLMMYAELAADGSEPAQMIVKQEIGRALELLAYTNNMETLKKLLRCMPADALDADALTAAAKAASEAGAEELFQMVVHNMQQRGMKTDFL